MKFEKWQALGNDYLIFEEAELTPGQVRRLCDPHFGPGADGVLILTAPDAPGFVARLRIFNPDGSEAELSGNGAREAILYLRRSGWTDADTFSIQTLAGEIRPTITGPTTCRVDMGRASLQSANFPSGGKDGQGEVSSNGQTFRFQHVTIGNPQCAIRVDDPDKLGPRRRSARRSSAPRSSPTARTCRSGGRSHPTPSGPGSSSAAWGRRSPAARERAARRWPTWSAAATRP